MRERWFVVVIIAVLAVFLTIYLVRGKECRELGGELICMSPYITYTCAKVEKL